MRLFFINKKVIFVKYKTTIFIKLSHLIMKKTKIAVKPLATKTIAIKPLSNTPRKGSNGGYTWVG